MKQLNKTLRSLKHKMDDLEANFEIKHGYKPSQVRHFLRFIESNLIWNNDRFLLRSYWFNFREKNAIRQNKSFLHGHRTFVDDSVGELWFESVLVEEESKAELNRQRRRDWDVKLRVEDDEAVVPSHVVVGQYLQSDYLISISKQFISAKIYFLNWSKRTVSSLVFNSWFSIPY